MPVYVFHQQRVVEYQVEAVTAEQAREILADDPVRYEVDSYLTFDHDQEAFFLVSEIS